MPIAVDDERRRHDAEVEALALRQRGEFYSESVEQLGERELAPLRREGAGIETRDVEQGPEQILDEAQRRINLAYELEVGCGLSRLPFEQRRDVEPRRVERLQQIMAGGGKKARLAEIGILGDRLSATERFVQCGQRCSALMHTLLQPLVGSGKLCGRLHVVG